MSGVAQRMIPKNNRATRLLQLLAISAMVAAVPAAAQLEAINRDAGHQVHAEVGNVPISASPKEEIGNAARGGSGGGKATSTGASQWGPVRNGEKSISGDQSSMGKLQSQWRPGTTSREETNYPADQGGRRQTQGGLVPEKKQAAGAKRAKWESGIDTVSTPTQQPSGLGAGFGSGFESGFGSGFTGTAHIPSTSVSRRQQKPQDKFSEAAGVGGGGGVRKPSRHSIPKIGPEPSR